MNSNTKMLLVPQNGVRYREVSAITARYKYFFYGIMTVIPSVLMHIILYREVSVIKYVRYREVPLLNIECRYQNLAK